MQETPVRFLGQEDPLEKGKAIHSSILAWRIPQTSTEFHSIVHGVAKSRTQLSDLHFTSEAEGQGNLSGFRPIRNPPVLV